MMRIMLKSKISYAIVREIKLYYKGSITIDERLMEEGDLYPGERVEILNLNNGVRLQTYVIKGKRDSGDICLNGPAARLGVEGDKIVIISYGIYNEEEVKTLKHKIIELDDENKIKDKFLA